MQSDIIKQLKDKLQRDLEQCAKDKAELKNQGLFSKSDVILGRETEIKELQEYIEGLEEKTTTDIPTIITHSKEELLSCSEKNDYEIKSLNVDNDGRWSIRDIKEKVIEDTIKDLQKENLEKNIKIERIKHYWVMGTLSIPPLPVGWEIYPVIYQKKKYVFQIKVDVHAAFYDEPKTICSIYQYREKKGVFTKHREKKLFEKEISVVPIGDVALFIPNTTEDTIIINMPQIIKYVFEEWQNEIGARSIETKQLECDWDGVIENKALSKSNKSGVEDDCGRGYVERTGKCPMCIACPHNCPLDNNNSGGVKV